MCVGGGGGLHLTKPCVLERYSGLSIYGNTHPTLCGGWWRHTVYPRSEVFSRSFLLQRGPAGAGRSKTSIWVNYTDLRLIYVLHLYQIIMVGTGKFSRVLWCKFLDIWFLVHLIINIFIFDSGHFSRQNRTFFM